MVFKSLHKTFLILCLIFVEAVLLAFIGAVAFMGIGILELLTSGSGLADPGVTIPSAFTWVDENANGKHDPNEMPLENVCIWSVISVDDLSNTFQCDEVSKSSYDGKWIGQEYYGYPDEEMYIIVDPPIGFKPTTPPIVKGTNADFGFVLAESFTNQVYSIDVVRDQFLEQDARQRIQLRVGYLLVGLIVFLMLFYVANRISNKILSLK